MPVFGPLEDVFTGNVARVLPTGVQVVAETERLCGTLFGGAADANFFTLASNGAGSAASIAWIATLTSGTAADGYGSLTTVRKARFLFYMSNRYVGLIRLPALARRMTTRLWGAFNLAAGTPPTVVDGYYYSYDGSTGVLSVNAVNNSGTPVSVSSGSFNGAVSAFNMDTNVHKYQIEYLISGAVFWIDNVLIHTFLATTVPLVQNIVLGASAISKNAAGAVLGATLENWSSQINREGKPFGRPQQLRINTNATTVLKVGAGTLHRLIFGNMGTTTNTMTVYDNTSAAGTVLWFSSGNSSLNTPSSSVEFGLDFYTGLTIVTATGTAHDFTVIYE